MSGVLAALVLAACAAHLEPLPLDDDPIAQPASASAPAAGAALERPTPSASAGSNPLAPRAPGGTTPDKSVASTRTLVEEALPASARPHDPPAAGAPPGANVASPGAASEAPSPVGTIRPSTAPNVSAATRLADAARTRLAAGAAAGALEQLERAIATDPNNPYAYFFLAELHLRQGAYDQAIAFADRAADLSQVAAPEWAGRAYALQGTAFEAAGRFADARGAYARAVRVAPGNRAAQIGLARLGAPLSP